MCPLLVSPTHQTPQEGLVVSSQLSPAALCQTAVLLWHCVPFSHDPVSGQLVRLPGLSTVLHARVLVMVYSNSFGAVGWGGREHNPFCALGCPADHKVHL